MSAPKYLRKPKSKDEIVLEALNDLYEDPTIDPYEKANMLNRIEVELAVMVNSIADAMNEPSQPTEEDV